MPRLLCSILLVVASAACSDRASTAIATLREHKETVCACRDAACRLTYFEDFEQWADTTWPELQAADLSSDQWETINALSMIIRNCAEPRR
jgi:hypothetical protein